MGTSHPEEAVREEIKEGTTSTEADQSSDVASKEHQDPGKEKGDAAGDAAVAEVLSEAFKFMEKDDFAKAVPILERFLEKLPKEKRDASCMHNLAVCHTELGNLHHAEDMFWEAASAWEREKSSTVAVYRTMYGLASVMTKQGEAAKLLQAEILLRDVLKAAGSRDDMVNDMYRSYVLLGENLVKQRKWDTAAQVWGYSVEMSERMFGNDHEIVIEHRAKLAKAQRMAEWQPYMRYLTWGLCALLVVLVAMYLYHRGLGRTSVADSGEKAAQSSTPTFANSGS